MSLLQFRNSGGRFGVRLVWQRLLSATLLLTLLLPVAGRAQAVRTQALTLAAGWNAVYLEVDPPDPDPAVLFAELPVDIVAAFSAPMDPAQFVQDPAVDRLRAYGWRVWYAPQRADAFLSRLSALNGATPYLIHATTPAELAITGQVAPGRPRWAPDAYNFTGFSVQQPGGPTFEQFFGASAAHNHDQIYRMREGVWRKVADPSAEVMRAGEAFWIFTKGRSDYMGPLDVFSRSPFGLVLTPGAGQSVVLRNRAAHPLTVTLEHLVAPGTEMPLALAVRTRDSGEARSIRTMSFPLERGNWTHTLPVFEAGEALRLPFEVQREGLGAGEQHSLLRVSTDLGTVQYLSITAFNDALSSTPTN